MATPPAPSGSCGQMPDSQALFTAFAKSFSSSCASPNSSPVCLAVARVAGLQDPKQRTLGRLAKELDSIPTNTLVTYFQQGGIKDATALAQVLMGLKCYLVPHGKDSKVVRDDLKGVEALKNWYVDKYFMAVARAKLPGIDLSEADILKMSHSMDKVVCQGKSAKLTWLVWVILALVVGMVLGGAIYKHRHG